MRKVLVVLTLVGSVACSGNDKAGSSGSSTTGGGTSGSSGSSGGTGGTTASCRDGHQVSHLDGGQCGTVFPDLSLAPRILRSIPGQPKHSAPQSAVPDAGRFTPDGTYVLTEDSLYDTSDPAQLATLQAVVTIGSNQALVTEDYDCRGIRNEVAVLESQGQPSCTQTDPAAPICLGASCGADTHFIGVDYELLDGGGFRLYDGSEVTTWLPAP